jgi:hypothetical protein
MINSTIRREQIKTAVLILDLIVGYHTVIQGFLKQPSKPTGPADSTETPWYVYVPNKSSEYPQFEFWRRGTTR